MQTFKKEERLCNKSAIDQLFKKGKHFFVHPFKVIWLESDQDSTYPAQIMISVSKRNFKKAVDRNYIKRIIRETYRKNKQFLYETLETKHKKLTFTLIYTAKEVIAYDELDRRMIQLLNQLISEHEKDTK